MALAPCGILFIGALLFIFSLPVGETWAEDSRRPNILLAISDDQSWPHTTAGHTPELSTPHFDRVAEAGVLFRNAFAASPGCSPSRAALLTGLHTWQIQEAGTHASSFPKEFVAFPDLLEQAGYQVGYTGKGWGPGNWKISGRERNPAGPAYSSIRFKTTPPGINKLDYAANFREFLNDRPDDQPFFFWYGATEPHRNYEKGAGIAQGKNPERVEVPKFLPDTPEIRSDLLDYFVEIEWFDQQLGKMLAELAERGELENTLVIITSDNGMPFPRAKANCYEYGIHMPLAISWPARIPAKRSIDDLVGFVDLTATILDAAGVNKPQTSLPLSGKSLLQALTGEKSGTVEPFRTAVYSARERHSSSRYQNQTYPQRAIRTQDFLLIQNFRPDRWPAGDPQKYEESGELGPMHAAYHDIDACPSLTFLVENRDSPAVAPFFQAAVGKRPEIELFEIRKDPACMHNLADDPAYHDQKVALQQQLAATLQETGDPRILNGGEIFESYPRYSRVREFPKPETKSETSR